MLACLGSGSCAGYPAPAGTGKGPLDSLDLNSSILNLNVISNAAQCCSSLRTSLPNFACRLLSEEDFSSISANSTELRELENYGVCNGHVASDKRILTNCKDLCSKVKQFKMFYGFQHVPNMIAIDL
jgi:hypothetical protein